MFLGGFVLFGGLDDPMSKAIIVLISGNVNTSAGRPRNGASPPLFVTITRFPFMLSGKLMTIS
jgi:hypothetical protein